jgi:hypothetical protein
VVSTHQVAHALDSDPQTARRWYVKRYGKAPSLRLGWTSKEVAALRQEIKRNQESISTYRLALELHVHHTVIERNWREDGFRLPRTKNNIGCHRSRQWFRRDVERLMKWLRERYKHGNVPGGRNLRPEFFAVLRETGGNNGTTHPTILRIARHGRGHGRGRSASTLRQVARSR